MKFATRSFCALPIAILLSIYGSWVAGRVALGRWPRSNLDDPKGIQSGLMWVYDLTALLIYATPLFCLIAGVVTLICVVKKPGGWERRLMELGAGAVLFLVVALFMRWDPQSVAEWFFD